MKPKEIIKSLKIENGVNGKNRDAFLAQMTDELVNAYNEFGSTDSERHFDAAVKIVRSKWDSISRSIYPELNENLWKFFYATKAVSLKKQLCPTWAERKEIEHAKYEKRKAAREAKKEQEEYIDY